MEKLWDVLQARITPQVTASFEKETGADGERVKDELSLAAALLMAALAARTTPTEGPDDLLALVCNDPVSTFEVDHEHPDGNVLAQQWLGPAASRIVTWLQTGTDVDVTPYLGTAATLLLESLRERAPVGELDSATLDNWLATQYDVYARAHPQLASGINAALDVGRNVLERAERNRARFSDEEWATLARVPPLAGFAVMMSSFSGPFGMSREFEALIRAMHDAAQSSDPDSLVSLVSREFQDPEPVNHLGADREHATQQATAACLAAYQLLLEKALPPEVRAYQQFVMDVAAAVAGAAREHTFLGFGGTPVSPEEKQVLDLLAAALNFKPA